jgi:zinc/manganese transport system permease protein
MIHLFSYPFVQAALLAALILAGIHSYLGFHVVSRGVIFVDISMAQAAAFGSALALTLGWAQHSWPTYLMSVFFTLTAAALISVSRTRDNRVPQEAFIGIIYAGFATLVMLLLAKHAGGSEELEELLAGSLLTIRRHDLTSTALLYSGIGIFHWLLRSRFFRISQDRMGAVRDGWKVGWWDFLFYATFGLVVTSSVHIAGVMLVFSFLVIPPVIALLFTKRQGLRLAFGWAVAFAASVVGIAASVGMDLPTGPSIIASLIVFLLIAVLIRQLAFFVRRMHKRANEK